jgi:hypothetical protein
MGQVLARFYLKQIDQKKKNEDYSDILRQI